MGYPLKFNVIRTEKLIFPEKGGKFGKDARGSKAHNGWDLKANSGTTVFSVGPGEITLVADNVRGYGTIIQLKFLCGAIYYWALYAHLSKSYVASSDVVADGKIIGLSGNTGNAKGQPTHLHFEIANTADLRKGRNNQIDPSDVLGGFLRDNDAGRSILIENSFPFDPLNIDEIDKAINLQSIA